MSSIWKRYTWCAILYCLRLVVVGQPAWWPVVDGQVSTFQHSKTRFLRATWLDSTRTTILTGITRYPNLGYKPCLTCTPPAPTAGCRQEQRCLPNYAVPCSIRNRVGMLGFTEVYEEVNGFVALRSVPDNNDTLFLKPYANVNDFFAFNNRAQIVAIVIAAGIETIFDTVTDSVKVYLLSNNDTIRLSKRFGLVQWPSQIADGIPGHWRLVGAVKNTTATGRNIPGFRELFTAQAGDKFLYETNQDLSNNAAAPIRRTRILEARILDQVTATNDSVVWTGRRVQRTYTETLPGVPLDSTDSDQASFRWVFRLADFTDANAYPDTLFARSASNLPFIQIRAYDTLPFPNRLVKESLNDLRYRRANTNQPNLINANYQRTDSLGCFLFYKRYLTGCGLVYDQILRQRGTNPNAPETLRTTRLIGWELMSGESNGRFRLPTTRTPQELPRQQVQVYPNPTTGAVFLRGITTRLPLRYSIASVQGQIVQQGQLPVEPDGQTSLFLAEHLPTGVYQLNCENAQERFTLMIQKTPVSH